MSRHRLTARTVRDTSQLRTILGEPAPTTKQKIAPRLNQLTRRFIEASPFVCLATSDSDGNCDVSPRGDDPGFVRIIDETTLLVPERPGNKLADSLLNMLQNPHVGMLFVIPGIGDTLRVNGRATITDDPELLTPCAVAGNIPKLGILVDIDSAFLHCSKAFLRSELWNPERHVERSELPSFGQVRKLLVDPTLDVDAYDSERAERYARRENLY